MITNIIKTQHGYLATIDGTEWSIPNDPGNRFWQMVQQAITDGAVVTQEQPPIVTPDPKLIGIEFDGIMCSATADDQAGLAAVLLAIQLQGEAFKPTRFYFSNGNILVISLANYQAFTGVWLPFRQSFFAVES
jgi:hypothetical protein